MAINWDKEYGTSEPKKSKINWEKEYNPTGFKERIDTEKADLRSKGLPVSVSSDRSAPTMGGSILRDILKVPATLLARPGQALASIKGYTPEEQTVKSSYLGDIKTVQTGKDVLSDVGRGLELASYGVGIGAGKNILAQSGKQTAKQIAKRTAIEGVVGGFAGSAGRVITNQSGNLKQDLKDIALGTGIGTIAGGALGYAGGRLGGKVLSAEERAIERAVGKGGKFNIPGVTTPKVTEQVVTPESSKTFYHTTTLENADSISKNGFKSNVGDMSKASGGNMQKGVFLYDEKSSADVFGKNFKNPKVLETNVNGKIYDANTNTKYGWEEDLQTQEIAKDPKIIEQLKKDGYVGVKSTEMGTNATFVFDENAVKLNSKISQSIPEQSPITKTPEFKSKVTEGETVLDNHYNNPDASPGSHKLYAETVYNDIANDPERVKRIAMGSNEATTNGVPADAYYAIAKNEAVKSGDINAIKELANSDVGSISGKKLEANKLTQEGDIVDTLREIKKARAKDVGVSEEAIKKQETTLVGKLKTTIKGLSDDIINDLICK